MITHPPDIDGKKGKKGARVNFPLHISGSGSITMGN